MQLKLSYDTTEFISDIINDSYSLKEVYYNDLSEADNSCSVKIPYSLDIQNFINKYSDQNIKAEIIDDTTNIFSGYVRKTFSFSKKQRNQPLSIEIVSPSYLLDVDTKNSINKIKSTLGDIVNVLLNAAGVSAVDLSALSTVIPIFTLEEGSNIKSTINDLLQQYGYVYDFNTSGIFYVCPLFSDIPADKEKSILQTFDGTNSLDEIKIDKSEQTYNGANVSWNEYKNISNKLIFADTTNGDANKNTCSIE